MPYSTDWNFGTGDFTIEWWMNSDALPNSGSAVPNNHSPILGYAYYGNPTGGRWNGWGFGIREKQAGAQYLMALGQLAIHTSVYATPDEDIQIPLYGWHHYAFVRQAAVAKVYVDGVLGSTWTTTSGAIDASDAGTSRNLRIGQFNYDDAYFGDLTAYVDEVRISNNARYTANFTPDTTEFSSDANTKLLIHSNTTMGSTTFTDSSSAGHTITAAGNVKHVAPKIGTGMAAYNGTTSQLETLTAPAEWAWLGTQDFTWDFWAYADAWENNDCWFEAYAAANDYWVFRIKTNGDLAVSSYVGGSHVVDIDFNNANMPTGAWVHVELSRSGSTWRCFINGTETGDAQTSSGSLGTANRQLKIGRSGLHNTFFKGYIDELRISNIVRHTSNFTPSTTAHKPDINTMMLLHMDGGGGIDPETNIPTLPGQGTYFWDAATNAIFYDAAGVPTNKSIISFDGNGDYLITADSSDWDFGTENWTIEFWINFTGGLGSPQRVINFADNTSPPIGGMVETGADNKMAYYEYTLNNDWTKWCYDTNAYILDTWYHYAIVREGSNFTMYRDGVEQESDGTSSASLASAHGPYIGTNRGITAYTTGSMDQIRISNTAIYTSAFTPPTTPFTADANTKLLVQSDFSEGGLGADHSNNYNYFTPTNLTASDMMEDSPMNNFCTFNPAGRIGSYSSSTPSNTNLTFTQGNLLGTGSSGASSAATFPITSGKWYWEIRTTGSGNANIGIYGSGNQRNSNTFTATAGNIYGIKFDADTGTGYEVSTNGGAYSSGGLNSVQAPWTPWFQSYSTNCHFNFGQDSSFAGNETAQGNQDGNDKGDFYYAPPSGYLALCTDNLADPSIALPADNFETQLWTGDGTTGSAGTAVRTFTPNFDPGMVWVKGRSVAHLWQQADILRGPNEVLISSGTSAQQNVTTDYGGGGIGTLGTKSWNIVAGSSNAGNYNTNNDTYAGWAWKADTTFDPTSAGTIAVASGKSNAAAGFSIVKYTGENAVKTIGHGLATAPKLIIVKAFEVSHQWECYYMRPDGSDGVLFLDQTGKGEAAGTGYWNDTNPTASVFTVGTGSGTGGLTSDYIAYCFTDIEGYSKVGKYFANSSADGPFIYTGFQPAFVIIKALDYDYEWVLFGDKMNPYNAVNKYLYVNNNNVETVDASGNFDIVSNGFKLRDASYNNNHPSGAGFLYYAVADIPFKTSNAR